MLCSDCACLLTDAAGALLACVLPGWLVAINTLLALTLELSALH